MRATRVLEKVRISLNFFTNKINFHNIIAKTSSTIVNSIVSDLANICRYFKIVSVNVRYAVFHSEFIVI